MRVQRCLRPININSLIRIRQDARSDCLFAGMNILAQSHRAEVRTAHRAILAIRHGTILIILQGPFRV